MTTDLKRLAEAAFDAHAAYADNPTVSAELRYAGATASLQKAYSPATILALCKRLEEAEHDLGVTKASLAFALDVAEAAERKVEAWGPIVDHAVAGGSASAIILARKLTKDLLP